MFWRYRAGDDYDARAPDDIFSFDVDAKVVDVEDA